MILLGTSAGGRWTTIRFKPRPSLHKPLFLSLCQTFWKKSVNLKRKPWKTIPLKSGGNQKIFGALSFETGHFNQTCGFLIFANHLRRVRSQHPSRKSVPTQLPSKFFISCCTAATIYIKPKTKVSSHRLREMNQQSHPSRPPVNYPKHHSMLWHTVIPQAWHNPNKYTLNIEHSVGKNGLNEKSVTE